MKWQIVEGDKVIIEQDTKPLYCAPGQRIREAPSPWPPRVWIRTEPWHQEALAAGEVVPTDISSHYARRGSHWLEQLSIEEHTHLLAEAVREAKYLAFEEAYRLITSGEASPSGLIVRAYRLREKASELRKGATLTPENGGKES